MRIAEMRIYSRSKCASSRHGTGARAHGERDGLPARAFAAMRAGRSIVPEKESIVPRPAARISAFMQVLSLRRIYRFAKGWFAKLAKCVNHHVFKYKCLL